MNIKARNFFSFTREIFILRDYRFRIHHSHQHNK